jgi:hypothetical protein
MTQKTVYFALGFGMPGCIPNGSRPYAVTTRREVRDAIAAEFYDSDSEARKALRDFGLRSAWQWAKRSGFSSYHREIRFGSDSGEILNFMGLTEAEYEAAAAEEY